MTKQAELAYDAKLVANPHLRLALATSASVCSTAKLVSPQSSLPTSQAAVDMTLSAAAAHATASQAA